MIVILDYGLGNPASIENMVRRAGGQAVISSDPLVVGQADKFILPGVGAFDEGMTNLTGAAFFPVFRDKVLIEKKPLLGICLGMQLLSESSEEGVLPGLGWIQSETVRFSGEVFSGYDYRVPHMGWTEVSFSDRSGLFENMYEDARFYFVHSYHVKCKDPRNVAVQAGYGIPFTAGIRQNNIYGVQFHPEKSHKYGLRLIENFLKLA